MIHHWKDLTSPQVESIGSLDDAVVIIPVGATEQHGPHLPLFTDSLFASALADAAAGRLDAPVLIAPVLHVGLSDHHVDFAGTITLEPDVYASVIRAHIDAALRLGADRIALISGHGGNFGALGTVAAEYAQTSARVIAYADLHGFLEVMLEAGRRHGVKAPDTDIHAGALETSFALELFPDLVGEYTDVVGRLESEPGWIERLLEEGMPAFSPNGVLGDPRLASAALGRRVVDDLAAELAQWMSTGLDVPLLASNQEENAT